MQNSETKFVRIFEDGRNLNLLQLSDAKLRTDDGCTFKVHRVTLARSSDYFRAMFCGMDTERSEFQIPGISGECLSDILCYVYTGEVQVTEDNTNDLIIAADYLLLKDLTMEIKRNLKSHLTKSNCLRILQVAHQISDKDIFRQCFRFIQTRFEGVMRCQQNELADLPLDILISILSDRSLYVYNEATVWKVIVEWAQKDIPLRMCHIPQLLMTLAMEDIGEELATEILQHEIISQNPSFQSIRSRQEFQSYLNSKQKKISDLDVLLSFMHSYLTPSIKPNSHRIPLKLHVMLVYAGAGNRHNLYITYDENPDLMHKITGLFFDIEPHAVIAVSHNIYIYDCSRFCIFDLRTGNCEDRFRMSMAEIIIIVATSRFIYVIGTMVRGVVQGTYAVGVHDVANNRWFYALSPRDISIGTAVAVEEKLFVVGNTHRFGGTMMQVFDPITQQWSRLPPPTVYNTTFRMVAYHQKIYLVGKYLVHLDVELTNIEVFDPAKNLWETLPGLPYTYSSPGAVVFNDQLIFLDRSYGYERNTQNVRWNDAKECWEKLDETCTFKNLHLLQLSCVVDDAEAIRFITKQSRDPETRMESLFI